MYKLITTMRNSLLAVLLFSINLLNAQISGDVYKYIHLNQEDKQEYKKHRTDWIEEMHKTPPNMNWRVLEGFNQLARLENYSKTIEYYRSQGKTGKDQMLEIQVGSTGLKGRWIEKGSDNQSGRMHTADIDFEDELIYAASSGGNIWRGTLQGKNWSCLNNGMQINDIQDVRVVRFGQTKRIIVTGNSPAAVWFTDDEGLNWERAKGLDSPANWGFTRRGVMTYGTNEYYILVQEWDYTLWKSMLAVYRSTDYGSSFTDVVKSHLSVSNCDIWTPRYKQDGVYFVHLDTLSKIENGIITKIDNISINHLYSTISEVLLDGITVNDKVLLYQLFRANNVDSSFVYRTDNHKDWTHIGSVNAKSFMRNSFSVSSENPDLLFLGGVDLWLSENNAKSWRRFNHWWEYYASPHNILHADICGVSWFKSPTGDIMYLISTDGGTYVSKDNITTVENLSLKGLNVSQYYSGYTYRNKPGIMYLGSQDQGFQRSLEDSGGVLSFEQTISGDYGHLVSSDGGDHLWTVYPGFVMLYTNLHEATPVGYSWSFNTLASGWYWMPPLMADLDNPQVVYMASGTPKSSNNKNSLIWKVSFNGEKLVYDTLAYNFGNDDNRRVSSIANTKADKNYFYALSGDGSFFKSSDKGITWSENPVFNGPGAHYFYGNSIALSEITFGKIFVGGNGYSNPGAYVTTDNGETWTAIDNGLPATLIYKLALTPDDKYLFAATAAGPFVYIVEDDKWYDLSTPESPDQTFWSVEYVPEIKTARFVTYGRGAWDFKIETYTSVNKGINIETAKPEIRVFPNPLQDYGTVEITLNKSAEGTLKIYDLEGRMIMNLFSGALEQGTTQFSFDRFSGNVHLFSGTYFAVFMSKGLAYLTKFNINE